jgi:hypothetical protein
MIVLLAAAEESPTLLTANPSLHNNRDGIGYPTGVLFQVNDTYVTELNMKKRAPCNGEEAGADVIITWECGNY